MPRPPKHSKGRKPVQEKRPLGTRVLIVCEGKTEITYFNDLCRDYSLGAVTVTTDPDATDPLSIAEYAITTYLSDLKYTEKSSDCYEKVYVVIDRDRHERFQAARDRIDKVQKIPSEREEELKEKLKSCVSKPCFEYWLLLHFEDTAKNYSESTGMSSSPCKACEVDLKVHLPEYEKNTSWIYENTKPNIEFATTRAEIRLRNARREAGPYDHRKSNSEKEEWESHFNPSTELCELVSYLRGLKS